MDVLKADLGGMTEVELREQMEVEVEVEVEGEVDAEEEGEEALIAEKEMGKTDQREGQSSRF